MSTVNDDMSCEDANDRVGFALHRPVAPCPVIGILLPPASYSVVSMW